MINNDVIVAAQQIKNYCYKHFGADGCMESCHFLRNDGKCELKNFYPRDWYISDDGGCFHQGKVNYAGQDKGEMGWLIMDKQVERIPDMNLMALQMIAGDKKFSSFYNDVYAAVSELIERRKASGEWRGLADDGDTMG